MLECDICLTLCEPTMTMTLRAENEATVIAACWECATAQLLFLTDRWREAIAEHNTAVGEMVRMFGLPVVFRDDPEPQPTHGPEYHADHAAWASRQAGAAPEDEVIAARIRGRDAVDTGERFTVEQVAEELGFDLDEIRRATRAVAEDGHTPRPTRPNTPKVSERGEPHTRPSSDGLPDSVHGWGVWHSEDRQWIGWGATHTIATEMIPSDAHDHLVTRPAVAIIRPDVDQWDEYMRTEGHDLFRDEYMRTEGHDLLPGEADE